MTIDQFLVELDNVRVWLPNKHLLRSPWTISPVGRVRTYFTPVRIHDQSIDCFCPVTFLAYRLTNRAYLTVDFGNAGSVIGLTPQDTVQIVRAADCTPDHDAALRSRLLSVLRLEGT